MTHDWSNSRLRTMAMAVQCRYCRAQPGQQCTTADGAPLETLAAHSVRMFDARRAR